MREGLQNRDRLEGHRTAIPAALIIGVHFSISALWWAASASGVRRSGGTTSCPRNSLLHSRVAQGIEHGGAKFTAHMGGRSLWHPHPAPGDHMEWGATRFFDRGKLR